MASDQLLINRPAVATVPVDNPVPASLEYTITAARASFNGAGAGTTWLPALQIIGPGGVVVATYADQFNPVSAGGSADVTFGPFLRSPGSTASGGITEIVSPGNTITVTNPTGPIVDLDVNTGGGGGAARLMHLTAGPHSITSGANWTPDLAADGTHPGDSSLIDLSSPTAPAVVSSGFYAINAQCTATGAFTLSANDSVVFNMQAQGKSASGDTGMAFQTTTTIAPSNVLRGIIGSVYQIQYMQAGQSMGFLVINYTGQSISFTVTVQVVRITLI